MVLCLAVGLPLDVLSDLVKFLIVSANLRQGFCNLQLKTSHLIYTRDISDIRGGCPLFSYLSVVDKNTEELSMSYLGLVFHLSCG